MFGLAPIDKLEAQILIDEISDLLASVLQEKRKGQSLSWSWKAGSG